MSIQRICSFAVPVLMLVTPVVAFGGPAVSQIPEPGIIGLLAFGGIAGVLVYMARRK